MPRSGLGSTIRQARHINTGYTQREAAVEARMSKDWWAQIESGLKDPPVETFARMCRVVGLTPAQIKDPEVAQELTNLLETFGPHVPSPGTEAPPTVVASNQDSAVTDEDDPVIRQIRGSTVLSDEEKDTLVDLRHRQNEDMQKIIDFRRAELPPSVRTPK